MGRNGLFRTGNIRVHIIPALVWIAATAGVAILFLHRAAGFQVLGVARSDVSQVCAPVDGTLSMVSVHLYDHVSKGQVLAVVDGELLKAQIATIAATAEQARAQLAPIQQEIEADRVDRELNIAAEQRRLAVDVEDARLEVLNIKADIAADRVTLADLATEVNISGELLAQKAVAPYELQKSQALYASLAEKLAQEEENLKLAEQQLQQAQARKDQYTARTPWNPSVDAALNPIRGLVTIQEKLMEELIVQQKALTIVAPMDGVVVQIRENANQMAVLRPGEAIIRKAGEIVLAGQPILSIAQSRPSEIIAYATGESINMMKVGETVELVKNSQPAKIARSQVTFIGPTVEQMPPRLWPDPAQPEWGRPFLVRVPEDMDLTPGEIVGVRGL